MQTEYQHPDHQRRVGELLQDYLERIHGMQTNHKRGLLFWKAYELGHSAGEAEVANVYADLLELVKP